jgi:hypothetical protein
MHSKSPRASAVGRVAALARSRAADDPEFIAARQELKALALEEHVRKTVAAGPPLTPNQLHRVAELLTPQAVPGE